MIRAALARCTVKRAIWNTPRAGNRPWNGITPMLFFLTADPKGWWCARTQPSTRPFPTGSSRRTLVRLAALTGEAHWRGRADRLFDGLLPLAAESPFGHVGPLDALDLRLRAARTW